MFDCILLMAGKGTRMNLDYNKIKCLINNKPLYQYSLEKFIECPLCNKIILVVAKEDYLDFKKLENSRVIVTIGGAFRQESVHNGLILANEEIVLIHDAARPNITEEDINKVYNGCLEESGSGIGVKVKDTIKCEKDGSINTLDRNTLWQMQTPQGGKKELLLQGLEIARQKNIIVTDDLQLFELLGKNVKIVEGSYENIKITTIEDIDILKNIWKNKMEKKYCIGHSYDTHRLIKGPKLMLGGINIPYEFGLEGHSDADVLLHTIAEAIIGALGYGDLGTLFPDSDMRYKNKESSYFVKYVSDLMTKEGYQINNIDCIVYLEKPSLKDYKKDIQENVAKLLNTNISNVNIKATTCEKMGYIGRMEGIAAETVVMLIAK